MNDTDPTDVEIYVDLRKFIPEFATSQLGDALIELAQRFKGGQRLVENGIAGGVLYLPAADDKAKKVRVGNWYVRYRPNGEPK